MIIFFIWTLFVPAYTADYYQTVNLELITNLESQETRMMVHESYENAIEPYFEKDLLDRDLVEKYPTSTYKGFFAKNVELEDYESHKLSVLSTSIHEGESSVKFAITPARNMGFLEFRVEAAQNPHSVSLQGLEEKHYFEGGSNGFFQFYVFGVINEELIFEIDCLSEELPEVWVRSWHLELPEAAKPYLENRKEDCGPRNIGDRWIMFEKLRYPSEQSEETVDEG